MQDQGSHFSHGPCNPIHEGVGHNRESDVQLLDMLQSGDRPDVAVVETVPRGQGFSRSARRANHKRGMEFPDFADFGTWDESFRTITWVIPEPAPGVTYCMPFMSGTFRDISGNGNADFELIFTVAKRE